MKTSTIILLATSLGASLCFAACKKNKDGTGDSGGTGTQGPTDQQARSVAAFNEVAKVLTHPRCINCHPSGDRPSQGDKMQPHQPPVYRGADNHGEVGMRCQTCHGAQNYAFLEKQGSIPGVPDWHLAPASMGWQNKSLHEICMQLKDAARNGGKTVQQIVEHHENDPIVNWAWKPGAGRQAPPMSHAQFVQWTKDWVANGAHCPNP